jgi:hypothetical protein
MQEETKPGLPEWMALVLLMLIWGSSLYSSSGGWCHFSSMEVGALRISISFAVLVPFVFKRIKRVPVKKLKYFAWPGWWATGYRPFCLP